MRVLLKDFKEGCEKDSVTDLQSETAFAQCLIINMPSLYIKYITDIIFL